MRKSYVTNPNLIFRFEDESNNLSVTIADIRKKYLIPPSLVSLFHFTLKPRKGGEILRYLESSEAFDSIRLEELFDFLLENNFLITNVQDPHITWRENNWKEALEFHLLSRDMSYIDSRKSQDVEASVRDQIFSDYITKDDSPPLYSKTPRGKKIVLKKEVLIDTVSVNSVLKGRRTSRRFSGEEVSFETLSSLINITFSDLKKVREVARTMIHKKPHFWALSKFVTFEVYFVALNISGIPKGVYKFDIKNNAIVLLERGDFSTEVSGLAIGQGISNTAAVFFLTSDLYKYMWRYRHSRALRNIFIETGALAQRLILCAQGHGLKNFLTPAMRDSKVKKFLSLKEDEEPLYIVALGK